MARLFGTAGIRGVTNREITPDLAMRLARAFADWLHEHDRLHGSVAVAHDTRYGAEMLARAAASGFASAGFHVQFYGCVPTGVFSMNLARTGQDGGLLVTGSHMPPDRIGLLLQLRDGSIAPFEVTDPVEAILARGRPREVPPDKIGRLEEAFHPYELYISECMQAVDAPRCRARKFAVLADPANGAASYIAKEFFEWLGCRTELIHFDPAPVPDRPSEPRARTVTAAIRETVRQGCDLGICFDVDADRVLFIDKDGIPLGEDTVGAVLAGTELKPGDICVVPVNSSGLIESVCRDAGARLEYCAVGQPHIVKAIKDHKAAYAYEETGKYYFPRRFLWADGLYSAARLLELMAKSGKSAAELAAALPPYHQARRNVPVEEARKDPAFEAAVGRLDGRLLEGRVRDVTVDGFKRVYADKAWLMLRKSGTEPFIRVYSDAPAADRAEQLARDGEALLRECL